jgi:hypothetical protein
VYAEQAASAEELLAKFEMGWRLDVDRYVGCKYDRIHIPDLFLKRRS